MYLLCIKLRQIHISSAHKHLLCLDSHIATQEQELLKNMDFGTVPNALASQPEGGNEMNLLTWLCSGSSD